VGRTFFVRTVQLLQLTGTKRDVGDGCHLLLLDRKAADSCVESVKKLLFHKKKIRGRKKGLFLATEHSTDASVFRHTGHG